jgi:hypothetical protein
MHATRFLAPVSVGTAAVLFAVPAAAAPPDRFVEARNVSGTFSVDCGTFIADIAGTFSQRFTVFFDAEGNVTRFSEFVSAPKDVWTNTSTGESIVVRGHFVQVATRIPGTDMFDRTVTGFRYMVNEPGQGVTIRDVGRIVYDDLTEQTWRDLAGQHELADSALLDPTFCGAIA